MILLDYSQIALASILTFQQDLKSGDSNKIVDLIRHVTLSSIKSYKKKYGKEYGEIVICCDGRKYWRREVFEFYKANRKKARDASDLDWKLIFDTLSQMREDIAKHFPYRVLHLDRAEADDIIAVMAKWTQDNGLVQQGLVEESQKVLILSSDHDFIQLQKYPNVSQWSPNVKKFIKVTDAERRTKYITHVVKAGDDGIPNILSPDNIFLQEGVRQKPVSAKRLAEFMELGFDACRNDEERRNWHRNVQLIDLDKIPADIEKDIIDAYLNTKVTGDKMSALKYLMDHRCRVLIEEIEDF
jgi:hypothetical protein